MICKNCGANCNNGESFCPSCGMQLEPEPVKPQIVINANDGDFVSGKMCFILAVLGGAFVTFAFGGGLFTMMGLTLSIVTFMFLNARKKNYGTQSGLEKAAWIISICGMSIGCAGIVWSIVMSIFSATVSSIFGGIFGQIFENLENVFGMNM